MKNNKKIKSSCLNCSHYDNNFCKHTGINLDFLYWTCPNYDPNKKGSLSTKINCSLAYISDIQNLKYSVENLRNKIDKIENSIPSQQLSEKITGSSTKANDERLAEYILCKENYEKLSEELKSALNDFDERTTDLGYEHRIILDRFYIKNEKAEDIWKSLGMSKRKFFYMKKEALIRLFDHLNNEFKRMSTWA